MTRGAAISLIMLLSLFAGVLEAGSFREDYLQQMAVATKAAVCSDREFLRESGITANECSRELDVAIEKCNRLIEPLVPLPQGTESVEDIRNVFRSLGLLYSMCVRAVALDSPRGSG